MKKTFIESTRFTASFLQFFDEDAYAAFQRRLMERPDAGAVMPGCGGWRKIRVSDPRRRKGKRGGARVIYLHVPEVNWIFLVDIYAKGEPEDLRPAEKRIFRELAVEFKQQALRAAIKGKEGNTT